ncbi:DUF2335 domain-containing protein [Tepidimonas taiwanensis]|uniref:DUF2335 domain-containing protein n=1 Tax=Tepidimonas taiwanensis TaxID=307486 RepID=UPI00137B6F59|nr:DUF2335 domain-containing protein [Tepidimonas taiwanensis]
MSQSRNSKLKKPTEPADSRVVAASQQWLGPVPPPAALEGFERIVPGAAARILQMAEDEQRHRHAIEAASMHTKQETVRITARDNLLGMVLGFLALAASLGAAIWSVAIGAPWQVSVALISLPVMIVAAELVRRKR